MIIEDIRTLVLVLAVVCSVLAYALSFAGCFLKVLDKTESIGAAIVLATIPVLNLVYLLVYGDFFHAIVEAFRRERP